MRKAGKPSIVAGRSSTGSIPGCAASSSCIAASSWGEDASAGRATPGSNTAPALKVIVWCSHPSCVRARSERTQPSGSSSAKVPSSAVKRASSMRSHSTSVEAHAVEAQAMARASTGARGKRERMLSVPESVLAQVDGRIAGPQQLAVLDRAEDDHVVAALVLAGGAALEPGQRPLEDREPARRGPVLEPIEGRAA